MQLGLGILIISSFLSCCAFDQSEIKDVGKQYLKNLQINEESEGFIILPYQDKYSLKFESEHTPEFIRISNCHRDVIVQKPKKKFEYLFIPNRIIEKDSCLMQITVLDDKGHHQYGAISFVSKDEKLIGNLNCNGKNKQFFGASVCQAKAGTIQSISFKGHVHVHNNCDDNTDFRDENFILNIKPGYCLYLFKDENALIHKLTTFGYNEILR